jgi:hypothetical protein
LGCVYLTCPAAIGWLATSYGNSPLPDDHPEREWAVCAVDAIFWIALFATISFIVSARRWWWLAALVALPLLVFTGVLAVTGGMWIDGSYL